MPITTGVLGQVAGGCKPVPVPQTPPYIEERVAILWVPFCAWLTCAGQQNWSVQLWVAMWCSHSQTMSVFLYTSGSHIHFSVYGGSIPSAAWAQWFVVRSVLIAHYSGNFTYQFDCAIQCDHSLQMCLKYILAVATVQMDRYSFLSWNELYLRPSGFRGGVWSQLHK